MSARRSVETTELFDRQEDYTGLGIYPGLWGHFHANLLINLIYFQPQLLQTENCSPLLKTQNVLGGLSEA